MDHMPLLDDITAYVTNNPHITVRDLINQFGKPVHSDGTCGYLKTYTELVFQRGGQFVHVRHRNFGTGTQIVRVREVVPMEIVTTRIDYVQAHPSADGKPTWAHETGIVSDAEAFLDALAR